MRLGVYRTLLWCYPASFRREYGTEMASAFAEQVQEARAHGGWPAEAFVWLHTLFDLLLTAPREHVHVMRHDLRYAMRSLASNPGFATVAILSLALGIGANTAIFSLLSSVLMRPLPVRAPHELVMLTSPGTTGWASGLMRGGDGERPLLSYAEFAQLRDASRSFSGLIASQGFLERVHARIDGGEPEEIQPRMVSADYFRMLGVSAVHGRIFTPREAQVEGDAPYAVISYDYWQRRFGGRPDILGVRMTIRAGVFSIIGVAPPSFFGETVGQRPDAWLPLSMQATVLPGRDWLRDQPGEVAKVMWLHVFGRLAPGVTMERAQAEANVIFQRGLAAHYGRTALSPEDRKNFLDQRLILRPGARGASSLRGQFSDPLQMLLAAAGVVLLIACANLGNLLLARVTGRNREISVRLALGANRGRLVRQWLTESMVLAALGGLVGLSAAFPLRAGLLYLAPDVELTGGLDIRVVGFIAALTLVAGLILGLLPAWRTTKTDAGAGLKEQGRGLAGSAAWQRVGKAVVVGQLALSVPLLVASSMLLQTLANLQHVDLGYPKERLLMAGVNVQAAGYEEARRLPLFERLLDRLRAVPGVAAVTYSRDGLFGGGDSMDEVVVEGYTPQGDGDEGSRYSSVGPGYFSTLGIPIILGREITEQDQRAAREVCVINEAFSKRFFDGRHPLGMRITRVFGDTRHTCQIVGVVADSRARGLRGEIEHRFYLPATELGGAVFAIRTTAEPSTVIAGVRRAVQGVDPDLAVNPRLLTDIVDDQMGQDRLLARLSLAFGVVGLLLAAIGLYGVLSYGVTRRTNEIGIRKALGAQHGTVIAMILRETGVLLAIGLVAGLVLAAVSIRLITSRLYGLEPTDPATFIFAVVVLAAVAFFAAWRPAYRASRVDPLVALRHE